VAELDAAGNVTHVFDLSTFNGGSITACSPTGLVAGNNGELLVGCGVASQSIILNPLANGGAGSIKTFTQVSGEDQVAYDPVTNLYYLAASNNPGGAILGIINGATDTFLQALSTVPGAHSVAVDPITGEAFVPFGASAGNTACTAGCIGVFALASSASVP
ncbi:MAG: hypothetical protein M3Y41_00885, partial [Pseudomonadota bacterium]|nr:hypothetical protein [Pseudomonadota bacterium]